MEQNYNARLIRALTGRRLHPDYPPQDGKLGPMLTFWGSEAGLTGGDVHQNWNYRIYVRFGADRVITGGYVVIEGDLLSPCSGYSYEALEALDYPAVLNWCLRHTLP